VELNEVSSYGILAGQWIDEEKKIMKVASFVEKPSPEYAKEHLAMKDGEGKTRYYCVFGQYIINKPVYDTLFKNVELEKGSLREVDMTKTLSEFAEMGLLTAVAINGQSFDIGLPQQYYLTMRDFSL
jgi:UTP-glucose-1-phosphate uridylyltransferase